MNEPTDLDKLKHLLHTMEGPITSIMNDILTVHADWKEVNEKVKKIEERQC